MSETSRAPEFPIEGAIFGPDVTQATHRPYLRVEAKKLNSNSWAETEERVVGGEGEGRAWRRRRRRSRPEQPVAEGRRHVLQRLLYYGFQVILVWQADGRA